MTKFNSANQQKATVVNNQKATSQWTILITQPSSLFSRVSPNALDSLEFSP